MNHCMKLSRCVHAFYLRAITPVQHASLILFLYSKVPLLQAIYFTDDETDFLAHNKSDSMGNPLHGNSMKEDLKLQLSKDGNTTVGDSVNELPHSTAGKKPGYF